MPRHAFEYLHETPGKNSEIKLGRPQSADDTSSTSPCYPIPGDRGGPGASHGPTSEIWVEISLQLLLHMMRTAASSSPLQRCTHSPTSRQCQVIQGDLLNSGAGGESWAVVTEWQVVNIYKVWSLR